MSSFSSVDGMTCKPADGRLEMWKCGEKDWQSGFHCIK